jgi:hypothetical protein
MRNLSTKSLLFLLATLVSQSAYSDKKINSARPSSPLNRDREIASLSNWYQALRERLNSKFHIRDILIAGGSSRELLDFAKRGQDHLSMYDFDVFAIANRKVSLEFAKEVSGALSEAGLGTVVPSSLEKRLRGNPNIPEGADRYSYDPGSGFLLKGRDVFGDINIFHSLKDLETNGIFSIDTVYLRIPQNKTLKEFVESELSKLSVSELVSEGMLYDPNNGYDDWVNERIKVVNSAELLRDPILKATRVIRSFSKVHKLSELETTEAWIELKNKIGESSLQDPVRFQRNLLKVLYLSDAALGLRLLSESGALKLYDPKLDGFVKVTPTIQLQEIMNGGATPEEKFDLLLKKVKSEYTPPISNLINCEILLGDRIAPQMDRE